MREKYYDGYLDPLRRIVWGELGQSMNYKLLKEPNLGIIILQIRIQWTGHVQNMQYQRIIHI